VFIGLQSSCSVLAQLSGAHALGEQRRRAPELLARAIMALTLGPPLITFWQAVLFVESAPE
jgi:hypothetical protein